MQFLFFMQPSYGTQILGWAVILIKCTFSLKQLNCEICTVIPHNTSFVYQEWIAIAHQRKSITQTYHIQHE